MRGRTGQAGPWPDGTGRPFACRKGGCVAGRDEPPSCVPQGRVRGRTGQAALLRAARAGAWPHRTSRLLACGKGGCVTAQDEPPSCVPQGRVRGRTGRAAFLRAARAGAWPHGTSRLLACRLGQALVPTGHQRPRKPFAKGLRENFMFAFPLTFSFWRFL